MSWYENYRKDVLACRACSARKEAHCPVAGVGKSDADVVFIGRNPGRVEDETGEPFTGKAGQIFDQVLMEVEWERPFIFITNLGLCHTKDDRLLLREEVAICVRNFLYPSIVNIKPKLVVVFGQQPNYFLNGIKSVNQYLGVTIRHRYFNCLVIPCIHPAAVIYNPAEFQKLQKVMRKASTVLSYLKKKENADA